MTSIAQKKTYEGGVALKEEALPGGEGRNKISCQVESAFG